MTLTLYYRSGCSLCEAMQGELLDIQKGYGFDIDYVDIDAHSDLVESYGHKVPVLLSAEGEEICHYFLDISTLDAYFSKG